MKLARLDVLLLTTLLLGGCAFSSGVQSHGAGAYRVEGSSEFGLGMAKERAFEDASGYCSSSGGRIHEISSRTGTDYDFLGDQYQTFELVFQCVGAGQSVAGPQPPAPPQPPPAVVDRPDPADLRQADAERDYKICSAGGWNHERIIEACERTLSRSSDLNLNRSETAIATYNIAVGYNRLGDNRKAISLLSGAIKIYPGYVDAYRLRAELFRTTTGFISFAPDDYEMLYRLTGDRSYLHQAEQIRAGRY